MSLQSWKDEFYPVTADEVANRGDLKEIGLHALRKWEGLRKENLDKHKVKRDESGHIFAGDDYVRFPIDTSTCSYCSRFYGNSCKDCPLKKVNYEKCFKFNREKENIFTEWNQNNNPEPMIKKLKEALMYIVDADIEIYKSQYKVGDNIFVHTLPPKGHWLYNTNERLLEITEEPKKYYEGIMWTVKGKHCKGGLKEEYFRLAREEDYISSYKVGDWIARKTLSEHRDLNEAFPIGKAVKIARIKGSGIGATFEAEETPKQPYLKWFRPATQEEIKQAQEKPKFKVGDYLYFHGEGKPEACASFWKPGRIVKVSRVTEDRQGKPYYYIEEDGDAANYECNFRLAYQDEIDEYINRNRILGHNVQVLNGALQIGCVTVPAYYSFSEIRRALQILIESGIDGLSIQAQFVPKKELTKLIEILRTL